MDAGLSFSTANSLGLDSDPFSPALAVQVTTEQAAPAAGMSQKKLILLADFSCVIKIKDVMILLALQTICPGLRCRCNADTVWKRERICKRRPAAAVCHTVHR